jgi:nicotinate-nucleotide adenylyltransferase
MRIGIIGGTFNPIHIGHLSMMDEIQKGLDIDKILIVPNANSHYKEGRQLSFESVCAMIDIAIHKSFNYEIIDFESTPDNIHYSFDTLNKIKKSYKKNEKLFFILGSDQFLNFQTWHKPEAIKELVNIIVPIRPPYMTDINKWLLENRNFYRSRTYQEKIFLKNPSEKMVVLYNLKKKIAISSAEIKTMFMEKKYSEAKKFLPVGIFEYIFDNKLYLS